MTNAILHAASLVLAVTSASAATPLAAHEYKHGSLTIYHPWTRATPPGARTGGGYLKIINTGTTPDVLLGGTSPIAGRIEIHSMSMDGQVMRMRRLADGLMLPPGGSIELKPGGQHIMFIGLKAPLKQGTMVPATLRFARAGNVRVSFQVAPIGAATAVRGGSDHGNH